MLVAVGAIALMPIQALDAEFRWANYEAGLIIGIPAVVTLFLLPNWGVHRNIEKHKSARVLEVQTAVNACDKNDFDCWMGWYHIAIACRRCTHGQWICACSREPLSKQHQSRRYAPCLALKQKAPSI